MRLSRTIYMCSIGINRNSNKTSFINDFNQDTVNKEAFNYAKNDSESDQYEFFILFCEMFSVYLRKKIWIRLDWMTQWIKIVRKRSTSWSCWKTNESWNYKLAKNKMQLNSKLTLNKNLLLFLITFSVYWLFESSSF